MYKIALPEREWLIHEFRKCATKEYRLVDFNFRSLEINIVPSEKSVHFTGEPSLDQITLKTSLYYYCILTKQLYKYKYGFLGILVTK